MKIGVVTDPESAAGYRLAGLETEVAADSAAAREALSRMVEAGAYALIAVSEALLADPYQSVRREMRGRSLPVLLAVPSPTAETGEGGDAEAHMRRLILATIGHEIKL